MQHPRFHVCDCAICCHCRQIGKQRCTSLICLLGAGKTVRSRAIPSSRELGHEVSCNGQNFTVFAPGYVHPCARWAVLSPGAGQAICWICCIRCRHAQTCTDMHRHAPCAAVAMQSVCALDSSKITAMATGTQPGFLQCSMNAAVTHLLLSLICERWLQALD